MFVLLAAFALKLNNQKKLAETMLSVGTDGTSTEMTVDEAISAIEKSNKKILIVDGKTGAQEKAEVDMEFKPSSMTALLVFQHIIGTLVVYRGQCSIVPKDTTDLLIKVVTPPKSDAINYPDSAKTVLPPLIFDQQPVGVSIIFQYNDLKGISEADAFIYESTIELPEYKVISDDYKFTFKSKEVNPKDYGLDIDRKYQLGYFEVKSKGLSAGATAAIIIVVIIVVVAIIVGVVFFLKRRSHKSNQDE